MQKPTKANLGPSTSAASDIGVLNKKSRLKQMKNSWQLYVFASLAFLTIFIFAYIPMYGVVIAFQNFRPARGIMGSPWVGFQHFQNFFNSIHFWPLLRNTLHINIYALIVGFPLPIILALAFNEIKDGFFKKFTQTVTYAPHFISVVVLSGMIVSFLSTESGIINHIVAFFGFERQTWLQLPNWFSTIFVWSGVWQSTGWGTVIFMAALSGVDPTLHEAAIVDGASRIQRIWFINLPTIMPTIIILLIMNVGSLMAMGFERVLLIQNPLNQPMSDVIATYVYRVGLLEGQFSFAAAIGLFNSAINAILLVSVNTITRKLGEVGLW